MRDRRPAPAKSRLRAVLVAARSQIYFGFTEDDSGTSVRLKNVLFIRDDIEFKQSFFYMAMVGPPTAKNCETYITSMRVMGMVIHGVSCALECSDESTAAWEKLKVP